MCIDRVDEELTYWCVDSRLIATCCGGADLMTEADGAPDSSPRSQKSSVAAIAFVDPAVFDRCVCARQFRLCCWRVMEDPKYNRFSVAYMWFTVALVLLATFTLIVGSLRDLQVFNEHTHEYEPNRVVASFELVCIIWFMVVN